MMFDFELVGKMPLIMHGDSIDGADEVALWLGSEEGKRVSVPGDDRTPPWKWQIGLYSDGEQVIIPYDNLMASIQFGASKVPIDESGKKRGNYGRLSQSGFLIHEEGIALLVPERTVPMDAVTRLKPLKFSEQADRVKKLGFSLYTKRVVVGKSRHIRVRPRFDQWRARGRIEIVDPDIKPAILKKILDAAGRYAGLGDRRPGAEWPRKPGPFGTYNSFLKAA